MQTRALIVAAFLSITTLAAFAQAPATSSAQPSPLSIGELMQATALDSVFDQFGATIATSPLEQGAPFDTILLSAWVEAAAEVFDAARMQRALSRALEGRFSVAEQTELASFFRSEFGQQVTALERRAQALNPPEQLEARAEGAELIEAMPTQSRRARQIDEMMELTGAQIVSAMAGESVRGMLIGMSVAQQAGDIQVPWEEIEVQLAQIMPGIAADIAAAQRAMTVYVYRDISDAEFDSYLVFLRTPVAQRFYALAGFSVGQIVKDSMKQFGETVAAKLARVNV